MTKSWWSLLLFPFMRYFRRKRLAHMLRMFPDLGSLSVLDVGGRSMIWEILRTDFGVVPARLVIVNTAEDAHPIKGYTVHIADGRQLPYTDHAFDLVFSNSVIEHVGDMQDMQCFASECMRVGVNVLIQTPNRWFPVEPHLLALFIHWFPLPVFHRLLFLSLRWWTLLFDRARLRLIVKHIHLLDRREFSALFPGLPLHTEKIFGMSKSFTVSQRCRH